MTAQNTSSEHNEQCAVIEWCKLQENVWPELRWVFAIPNGAKLPYKKTQRGKRYSREAIWLIKEGLKAGVSDLFAPFARNRYHGLFIEMKWGSNKPTESQDQFLKDMAQAGYYSCVCWGADAAIKMLELYLQGRTDKMMEEKENVTNYTLY